MCKQLPHPDNPGLTSYFASLALLLALALKPEQILQLQKHSQALKTTLRKVSLACLVI